MNKEEKEAYKYLEQAMFEEETTEKYVNILLNYIDKLQKENEELKEKLKSKEKQIKLMQEMNLPNEIEKNYISKDFIRTKIKELEEKGENYIIGGYSNIMKILKELLGE